MDARLAHLRTVPRLLLFLFLFAFVAAVFAAFAALVVVAAAAAAFPLLSTETVWTAAALLVTDGLPLRASSD